MYCSRMWHVRQTVVWLCSLALFFASGLGQGVVLCFGVDGAVRVEAAAAGPSCHLSDEAVIELPSARGQTALAVSDSCGGCEDVAFADRSPERSPTSDKLLESGPLVFAWLITHTGLASEPLTRPVRIDTPPRGARSSDLYAVRETVILLI